MSGACGMPGSARPCAYRLRRREAAPSCRVAGSGRRCDGARDAAVQGTLYGLLTSMNRAPAARYGQAAAALRWVDQSVNRSSAPRRLPVAFGAPDRDEHVNESWILHGDWGSVSEGSAVVAELTIIAHGMPYRRICDGAGDRGMCGAAADAGTIASSRDQGSGSHGRARAAARPMPWPRRARATSLLWWRRAAWATTVAATCASAHWRASPCSRPAHRRRASRGRGELRHLADLRAATTSVAVVRRRQIDLNIGATAGALETLAVPVVVLWPEVSALLLAREPPFSAVRLDRPRMCRG